MACRGSMALSHKMPIVLLGITYLAFLSRGQSDFTVMLPEVGFSGRLGTSDVIGEFGSVSLPACYHRCLVDLSCMSFFYSRDLKNCQLLSIVFRSALANGLVNGVGYEYYRINYGVCSRQSDYMMNRKDGVCFKLIKIKPNPRSLEERKAGCQANSDGRMMIVNTPEKQDLVAKTVDSFEPGLVNIGLTRTYTSKPFRWDNGVTLTWSLWCPGEPSPAYEECTYMDPVYPPQPYQWNDAHCRKVSYVACELR